MPLSCDFQPSQVTSSWEKLYFRLTNRPQGRRGVSTFLGGWVRAGGDISRRGGELYGVVTAKKVMGEHCSPLSFIHSFTHPHELLCVQPSAW